MFGLGNRLTFGNRAGGLIGRDLVYVPELGKFQGSGAVPVGFLHFDDYSL